MCGFDALTYAVCRRPAAFCCASMRTAVATAANDRTRTRDLARINASGMNDFLLGGPRGCRRLRLGKLRRVHRRVRAHLRQLEVVAAVEPRLRELERQLEAVDVAIIRIIHQIGRASCR